MSELIFPTDRGLTPLRPPTTGMFQRDALLAKILTKIERGEYVAVWGPRFTGRTTLIQQIGHAAGRLDDCLPVYTVPADHLDPSNREALFQSLAQHIQNAQLKHSGAVATSGLLKRVAWDAPGALQDFLNDFLREADVRRLLVLLDDCDQLLSTSLVELIRELRAIYNQRGMSEWEPLKKLSFVVAGAVSFRNLKLLESAELSPFDDWATFRLSDPSSTEVIDYLSLGLAAAERDIDAEAQRLVIEYCGGDLNRVNHLCAALVRSTSTDGITAEQVDQAARHLIATYRQDPSSSYMIGVITHDPRCLLVLDRLMKGLPQFERNQVYRQHDQYFGISNPELSGGFILERTEAGDPSYWRFRNRFTEEVLGAHFTAASMMRAFLDLGRPKDCLRFASELNAELVRHFREEIYSFDENALREWLEAQWEHRRGDRVEIGFGLVASLLETFGFDDVVLYEKPPGENRLVPNKLLPAPLFNVESTGPIDLGDRTLAHLREVRVYRTALYSVEIQAGGHLKVVVPLKDFSGELSGVVSFRSQKFKESWATLFVRIPIVERALNFVWRRLSRVEAEQQAMLQRLGGSRGSRRKSIKGGGIPVFVATKFHTPLHRHLERQLSQFPEALSVRFLDFKAGAIYDNLVNAMQEGEPLIIFDISKINNNVFFEMGLAIGLNQPGFPVLEQEHKTVPELARGLFAHIYTLKGPLGEAFVEKLIGIWMSYNLNQRKPAFVHMLEWSYAPMPVGRDPYLVVVDHNRFNDIDKFRGSIRKVAARLGWSIKFLWDRRGRLERHRELSAGTILPTQYALLRNAKAVVARVEKVDDNAEESSRFITVGIAKGLEVKLHQPAVILCQRESTHEGEGTSVPSDLHGLPIVPFDPEDLRSFNRDLDLDLHGAAARVRPVDHSGSVGSASTRMGAKKRSEKRAARGASGRSRRK